MSCEDGIGVLRVAARHRDALALAVRLGDDLAVSVNAARLRRAVLELYRVLGATAAVGGVEHLSDALAPWIAFAECVRSEPHESERLVRWLSSNPTADLFEVNAHGADLRETRWSGLRVRRSIFRELLATRSAFDECTIEDCDLSRACLLGSSLRAATFVRTRLAGSLLVDIVLDEARFEDCDLRGSRLAVLNVRSEPSTVRTVFIRCDLRDTSWFDRDLRGVQLIDCKLHGARGAIRADRVELTRPDLSPGGDSAIIGNADAVLRGWREGKVLSDSAVQLDEPGDEESTR